jgi:hypothetical protein
MMHAQGIIMMIAILIIVAAIAGAWWLKYGRSREPWDKE